MYRLDEVTDEDDSKYSWHDEDLSRWRKVNHWDSPGGGDILDCGCCPGPGLCPLARAGAVLLGWTHTSEPNASLLFSELTGVSKWVHSQGQLMRCGYVNCVHCHKVPVNIDHSGKTWYCNKEFSQDDKSCSRYDPCRTRCKLVISPPGVRRFEAWDAA